MNFGRCFFGLFLLPPVSLGHVDENGVILAAMKLEETSNYSWRTTISDDARTYVIEGHAEAGGYARVRLPLTSELALRMKWTPDETVDAIFKGRDQCVVRTRDGWKTPGELPARDDDWRDSQPFIRMHAANNLVTAKGIDAYSNAQFGLNRPHEELAIIVSCFHHLQISGNTATGDLSNIGAQLLLVTDGQDQLKAVVAAGRFKLWLGSGRVEKYQLQLEGVLLKDNQPCLVHQLSSTVVDKIGTSLVEVPEAVRQKFER